MEEYGTSNGHPTLQFERNTLRRIMEILTEQEREHAYYNYRLENGNISFDLFLEQGSHLLDWPEKTAIEVKYELMPDTIYRIAENRYIREALYDQQVNRLILFYKTSDPTMDRMISSKIPGRIELMSSQKFSGIIRQREKEGYIIPKQKDSGDQWIATIEEKQPSILLKDQSLIIEDARRAFHHEKISIFLGAGVSVDAGLPNWSKLLEGMLKRENKKPFYYLNEENSDAIIDALANSSIVVGRYTYNGYGDMKRFSGRIKKILYAKQKDSRLVDMLCSVLVSETGREHVAHVITYNYDDLIEQRLDSMQYEDYYSVYGKNRDASKKLPIYHVHGMIPQRELISSTPILSEKDYHNLYKNNHNWANVVQLYSMNNTTCFFIGLSMTDPNLRRLLDFSRSDEGISRTEKDVYPHYVFLQKKELKGASLQKTNEEHWREMELMMNEFGINIIWYGEHGELPGLIRQIML